MWSLLWNKCFKKYIRNVDFSFELYTLFWYGEKGLDF